MIGGNQSLHNYVTNGARISFGVLNVLCLIAFIAPLFFYLATFGALPLVLLFLVLGKNRTGWFYAACVFLFLRAARHSSFGQFETGAAMVAQFLCIVAWAHANWILYSYHTLAGRRIVDIERREEATVDELLEKGLLYWKVLRDKPAAECAFIEALARPQGGTASRFQRAGKALVAGGSPAQALECFDRALELSTDKKEIEEIKKNREAAVRKLRG